MTILNALKKLHKKMTGQETTSKTIGGVLDSMQENYTGGGASDSDDTYETIAGIAVGEMEYADGGYSNESSEFDVSEEISAGETYYFNSTANPSTSIIPEENAVLFNCEIGEGGYPIPIVPNKAWFYIVFESDHKTIVGSYDNAIENTTVTILKKVSGGGQTSNSAFIVEADGHNNIDIELEDIYNAALAGKQIYLKISGGYRILTNFYRDQNVNKYYFTFISLSTQSISIYHLNNLKKVQQYTYNLADEEEPS